MRHISCLLLAGVALAGTTPVFGRAPEPALLRDVLACESQTAADARLACFDKSVAAFKAAAEHDELVVVDRDQMRTARRSLFGFSVPKLPMLGFGGKQEDDSPELTTTVASAGRTADGHWRLVLADGAVWLQIDDAGPFHAPHAGSTVAIKRALLGTYFIRCDGQIGFRARRVA